MFQIQLWPCSHSIPLPYCVGQNNFKSPTSFKKKDLLTGVSKYLQVYFKTTTAAYFLSTNHTSKIHIPPSRDPYSFMASRSQVSGSQAHHLIQIKCKLSSLGTVLWVWFLGTDPLSLKTYEIEWQVVCPTYLTYEGGSDFRQALWTLSFIKEEDKRHSVVSGSWAHVASSLLKAQCYFQEMVLCGSCVGFTL